MPDPVIALTTDFGEDSPYVASVKGVILGINPAARLVDLTHLVPPQDLRYAAFFLATAVPCFPPGVIHVVVVDPGVGSERALLHVETHGQRLLVPDNGCWTELAGRSPQPPRVRRLAEPRFWRHPVSATFHGRDILGPVAGHVSLGVAGEQLGPPADDWVRLDLPTPRITPGEAEGEVVFVDHFGNLITNVPGDWLLERATRPVRVTVGDVAVGRRVRTYAEAEPGAVVALVGSSGLLEVAVAGGSAAATLQLGAGAPVVVSAAG